MEILVIIVLIIILVGSWVVSVQRRLVVMDENINNAMNQIGVQLSSRFDMLIALLSMTQNYTAQEAKKWIETVASQRKTITAKSLPEDVLGQEAVMGSAFKHIERVAEDYPELKQDKNYVSYMDAAVSYEKMVRTSCLIYNDSVTKLNKTIRMLPTSLVAGLIGFHQREYLMSENRK